MRKIASAAMVAFGTLMLIGNAEAAAPQSARTPTVAVTIPTAAEVQMVVSHAHAHLRKEPSTKSAVLATLNKGDKLTLIEKVAGGKWAHVKTDKAEGYVALSLLK